MKRIRIINGVYGHRPAGSKYVQPKRVGDPPFEVEDDKAEHLVSKGVAVYVIVNPVATPHKEEKQEGTSEDTPESEHSTNGDIATDTYGDESLDDSEDFGDGEADDAEDDVDEIEKPEYNADMKLDTLKAIGEPLGIIYSVGMKKIDYVALLDAYFDGEDDGETLPDLNAEDPVI